MLLFDQRDHIHTTGDYFTTDGRAGNRGVWEKDQGQYDCADYVFAACGGASAYRKSMLDQIGLLDNDYFFLLEDIDLAWRAQLAGYKVLYVPGAVVYHRLSATGGAMASFYDGRNSIWLVVKNLPAALWRKYAPPDSRATGNAGLASAEGLARTRGAGALAGHCRRVTDDWRRPGETTADSGGEDRHG